VQDIKRHFLSLIFQLQHAAVIQVMSMRFVSDDHDYDRICDEEGNDKAVIDKH